MLQVTCVQFYNHACTHGNTAKATEILFVTYIPYQVRLLFGDSGSYLLAIVSVLGPSIVENFSFNEGFNEGFMGSNKHKFTLFSS